MNKIAKYINMAFVVALCSCSEEAFQLPENAGVDDSSVVTNCPMRFKSQKPSFEDESRAQGSNWVNGDVVYIQFFKADNTEVSGKATYSESDDYWNLEYTGTLPSIEEARCYTYYLDGEVNQGSNLLEISATTGIYFGEGIYSKNSDGVILGAHLYPYQSRVKFTGQRGQTFSVSGLKFYTAFNPQGCKFYYNTLCETSIANDGSSPYLYLTKYGLENPTISVSYDNCSFSKYCDSPILDDGKSGYMKLPTKNSHNGWTMTEISAPTVARTNVLNITANSATFESSLTSDGNSTVVEHGFVYSTSSEPTINDNKVVCRGTSFTVDVEGLSKTTTYFVRSYAINSIGVGYGEQTEFKTQAGPVEVTNGMTAMYMFENDFDDYTENHYDGFGVSNPVFVEGVTPGTNAVKFTKNSYMKVGSTLNDGMTQSTAFWIKDPGDGSIFATLSNGQKFSGPIYSLEMEGGMLRYVCSNYLNTYTSYRENTGFLTHPSITDGKWHHIVLVTDHGATTYAQFTTILYVDGKKVDSITENQQYFAVGLSFQLGGSKPIGYQTTKDGAPFTIDNLRTYNRCISADEVKKIYESEK